MIGIAALSSILAAAAAGLAVGPAAAQSGSAQVASRAPLAPVKADLVVVLKGERRLVLMRGDQVVGIYRIALGRYPDGAKTMMGDARTPEGSYTLDYRLDKSAFYKAIHISYPNARDRARARSLGVDPGGKIMIHGLPPEWSARQLNHPKLDWTQGCIAVTNREIDEIWRTVADGTPIEIHP